MKISAHQATRSTMLSEFSAAVGSAEHQIIDTRFSREHGVVAGRQMTGADDAIWLQLLQRLSERHGAGFDLDAIEIGPQRKAGVFCDEAGGVAPLRERRQGFDDLFRRAFVRRAEPQ